MAPGNSLNCLAEPHANANITIIIAHGPQTMTKAIARPVASKLPPPAVAVNPKPDSRLLCCSRMPPPSAVPRDAQLPPRSPAPLRLGTRHAIEIYYHAFATGEESGSLHVYYCCCCCCCLAAHTL